jgi:hypothetical protein
MSMGEHQIEKQALLDWAVGKVSKETLLEPAEPFDWQWLIQEARKHLLDALIAHHLLADQSVWPLVPARVQRFFVSLLQEAIAYEGRRAERINLILGAFEEAALKVVVIKGPSLALLYPRKYLRRYHDLDIFVSGEDFDKTKAALYGLDYKPCREESTWLPKKQFAHHWSIFYRPDEIADVEIHDSDHHSGGYLGLVDFTEWVETAQTVEYAGRQMPALPRETQLLYLCTHFHRHLFVLDGIQRLKQVVDFYYLIQQGLDWEKFMTTFQRYVSAQEKVYQWWQREIPRFEGRPEGEKFELFDWGEISVHVHFCLALLEEIYGPIVPAAVLEGTRPKEARLLDAGGVIRGLDDERLYLWTVPRLQRFLDYNETPVEQLMEQGMLSYWRQLPRWTTLDDVAHREAWCKLCERAPRIKP